MKYFLLVYDRRRGKITDRRDYTIDQREAALADRSKLMHEFAAAPDAEVVLLGADSYEDLKKTHARYFRSVKQLKELAKTG